MILDFFNKRVFIIFIFPLILGGITVLGFQPFNLFFVNFFSLPLLFFTILYVKKKSKSTYRKKPYKKTRNLILKIGLLSDTHSTLHPKVFAHFKNCDEIWHAGDIGDPSRLITCDPGSV